MLLMSVSSGHGAGAMQRLSPVHDHDDYFNLFVLSSRLINMLPLTTVLCVE